MNDRQRLMHLFKICGLSDEGINYAEICAYCQAFDCVREIISSLKDGFPVPAMVEAPFADDFSDAFSGCEYDIGEAQITFSSYDPETIGELCKNRISPFMTISLGGNGKSWNEIEESGKNWHQINSAHMRWSMIRSV